MTRFTFRIFSGVRPTTVLTPLEASYRQRGTRPVRWRSWMTLASMLQSLQSPRRGFMSETMRARRLARRCNELSASLIQRWPDRFGGFAALPLPDVAGALAELAYADDVLNLDGVVLFSNANGVYLGDNRFEPVFEELERRRAVGFVHPTASLDPAAHQLGLPDNLIDFTADTTRAVAQML